MPSPPPTGSIASVRDKLCRGRRLPRGHSSAGRARGWQPRGRGFEPPWLHSMTKGRLRAAFRVEGEEDSNPLLDDALGRLAPELLEAVVLAGVRGEDVDDHVEVVHEDPAGFAETLDTAGEQAVLL